jgi:glycolate oxidase FAD binding subunit
MSTTITPADQPALAAAVREAIAAGTPIYPVGGGTGLGLGLAPNRPGIELSLAKLNRVVDYPARDMTITVEAGITMAGLAATLATERQRLPIDVPQADRATLGGVIATNSSGPLRYGHGTIRDYVIGISAVDGHGTPFKGGGRVVKNVAGYDFCKLLTGSLGTLGVITQVTLKVKPIPEQSALVACGVKDVEDAERLLAALATSRTTPAAIELVAGPAWSNVQALEPLVNDPEAQTRRAGGEFGHLIVALEGTAQEVEWMKAMLVDELQGRAECIPLPAPNALWQPLREFAATEAALVLKANVPPSRTVEMIRLLCDAAPDCSIQAHAGNGIIIANYPTFPAGGVSRILVGRLQPAAQNAGGNLIVLSSTLTGELTRQAVWGATAGAAMLMEAVKRQFDPKNLLNPGRFVYST